jgi:WD40 repeat protein
MGGFYGSIHVKTPDRTKVKQAVEVIAKRQKTRFLLGPALNGWVSVYPETHGQDERIAKAMARQIGGDAIYVMVHDDDIFAYTYFQGGKQIDSFNSCPDYFSSASAKDKVKLRGRPLLLQKLLAPGKNLEELTALLSPETVEQMTFAYELLERFADLLGLPNAVAAYEYLMGGETDHIQRWEDFIHVPDQTDEKARRRATADRVADEKERLRQTGILVYERQGEKNKLTSVTWCPDRTGDGFLVCWQDFRQFNASAQPLERLGPPWAAGPQPTTLISGPYVHQLRLSPSGRLLAVGNAGGNWTTVLWDLENQRQLCEIKNDPHTAPRLLFAPDEKYLVGHANEGVVVYATATGERIAIHATYSATYATMHPSGLLAIGDPAGKLIVLDPIPGRRIKTLCLGQKVDQRILHHAMQNRVRQSMEQFDIDKLRAQMEKQIAALADKVAQAARTNPQARQSFVELGHVFNADGNVDVKNSVQAHLEKMRRGIEETQQRMAEAFSRPGLENAAIHGSEQPASLLCSPDGRWLFCGTKCGLRVYHWTELLAAEETTPPPVCQIEVTPVTNETAEIGAMRIDNRVQALAFDSTANRLLFSCQDGQIRCLDLSTGQHRTFLALPGSTPVSQMDFSSARRHLCFTVYPPPSEQRHHNGPATLQVWDYDRLTERLQTEPTLRLVREDEAIP